jgi:thiosulfate/3-mercaptopyruvate sulfurtransferase|nr:MAG: sulfurtransferase [Pseudomonadota bacterium]
MEGDSPAGALLPADALRGLLGRPEVLVVDCRFELTRPAWGREAHAAGHVPGAVFAAMEHDLAAPRGPGTGRHPLPSPGDFARVLSGWGFTDGSHVVAYDQGNGAWAARLWWMLRSRGHRHVQVLDGGWAAWLAAGGAVSSEAPSPVPTPVQPRPWTGVMDSSEVEAALARGDILLVDARGADRFAGRNETIDPVAGHVPGAVSMPFAGNVGADQHWLSADALRARWQPVIEAAAGRPVVAMCGSGITACHNLLALELAGHRDTRLYAGSWSEWITDPARPIATGGQA